MSKDSTAEGPVADHMSDGDGEIMANCQCDSNEECDGKNEMDIDSQPLPVESVNRNHELSVTENSQPKLFSESSQPVDGRSSPLEERSSELENTWNLDKSRRDQPPKRRKRSCSSDSDESDYEDSRHPSDIHSPSKRSNLGLSSDDESDRERYSVSRFERVHTRNKPEYQRPSKGRDRSRRHTRNGMSRNRGQRRAGKSPQSQAHDIERERKLNFKFNRSTQDTAKVQQYFSRVLYE